MTTSFRRPLLLLGLWLACAAPVMAQDTKPSREQTVDYINNVLAKAVGGSITSTGMGAMQITAHTLSYDKAAKAYRTGLTETLSVRDGNNTGYAWRGLERWGWNFKGVSKIEDLPSDTTTVLRRVKVSFTNGSVRQKQQQQLTANGRQQPATVLEDNTINFVTFFYRASDPDDGKRLRNAALRLKELDEAEVDPFLQ